MTWTSDHKYTTETNLMGLELCTPSYFPVLNTEPRDRTDKTPTFYFEGFMVYQLSDAKNDIYNPIYL